MNPIRSFETQCTQEQFLRHLPNACGYRPFEIMDNEVRVHDGGREIGIRVHDEPVRNLGSLALPKEAVRFEFVGYDETAADELMAEYRRHAFRVGGG